MEQEKNKVPSQENENPGLEKFQRAQELYDGISFPMRKPILKK